MGIRRSPERQEAMTPKTERWLTWVMAAVGVVGLVSMLMADLFAIFFLEISCRELIRGGNFMNAVTQIARSMTVVLVNGFFVVTILVACGVITSRRVCITLWAISMVLYASLTALGVAASVASLSQHVSTTTVALDCVITMGFVVITMISVSLLRQAVASGRTPNSAVTLP
jgi:hypothetical protein